MRLPHQIKLYSASVSADSEGSPQFSFEQANTYRAFVQQNPDTITFAFDAKEIRYSHDVFFKSKDLWDAATVNDEIEYDGKRYLIRGKQNLCNLGRMYKFQIEERTP